MELILLTDRYMVLNLDVNAAASECFGQSTGRVDGKARAFVRRVWVDHHWKLQIKHINT